MNAWPERLSTMPSTTVETLGSAATEKVMVPTPRITMALLALVVPLRKVTEGTSWVRPSRLVTPAIRGGRR